MASGCTIVRTFRTLGETDRTDSSRGTGAAAGPGSRAADEYSANRPVEGDGDALHSRRRVLAGGAAALGTLGVAGVASASSAAASQSGGPSINVAFADDEIDAGDTTRLELVLSEVPEAGLTGWTLLVELTGSGSAAFTGEGEFSDDMSLATIDLDNTDSDAAAYLNGANAGGVEAGDTDVLIGDVEIQGVEAGDVETSIDVQELSDASGDENDRIDADVGSASLTVVGSAPDLEIGDSDGSGDGGSGDGDGSSDPDPAPGDGGDGDGSDGGDGDGSDGGDGDGGDGDGSTSDDGGSESEGDSGSDGTPGFGIGAAVAAVFAGTAARIARRAGEPDDGE